MLNSRKTVQEILNIIKKLVNSGAKILGMVSLSGGGHGTIVDFAHKIVSKVSTYLMAVYAKSNPEPA